MFLPTRCMNIWHAHASFWDAGNSFRFSSNFLFTCHEGASVDSLAPSKSPHLFNTCCKTVRQHHMCSIADTQCALWKKGHGQPTNVSMVSNMFTSCLPWMHINACFDKKSISLDILLNIALLGAIIRLGIWSYWLRNYRSVRTPQRSRNFESPQPQPDQFIKTGPNILSLFPHILKSLWWDWL